MRKLTLGIAIVLAFAACGDDDSGVFDTDGGGEATTSTSVATTAPADDDKATATTAAGTGAEEVQKKDPAEERKDPADVQNFALSKSGRSAARTDAAVATDPTAPPDSRGDDPHLDALWSDCAAGDMDACDALYRESPIGSAYERFGDTCGGTTAGGVWCSIDDAPPVDDYLDGLWDDCADADWTACDALYMESPVGSDYEDFGGTCGYLTDGIEWCVDEFPATDTDLDGLWDDCAAGDWAACDSLFIESPVGSDYEDFGGTCGYLTDGTRWCTDEFGDSGSYGSDPYLDGLWDACESGDWAACDALYSESPIGSEYEEFGGTCGYLTDGSEWCVDEGQSAAYTYGDDPNFDGLWDACSAGDWEACDTLYMDSPIDSEYEAYGNTCGYLTDGVQWCVDAMSL